MLPLVALNIPSVNTTFAPHKNYSNLHADKKITEEML